MSFDLKLSTQCDHRIIGFDMPVTGISPNFYGQLEIPCNGNTNSTFIRSYHDDLNATYRNNLHIGITNYVFSNDYTQIIFGIEQPITSGMRYPYVFDGQIPYNKYLIDYVVNKDDCPKCRGNGYLFDISYDASGKLNTITGSDKLKQEIVKILLSELQRNQYHLEYGSDLSTLVGGEIGNYTITLLQKYVNDALSFLSDKQSTLGLPSNERYLRTQSLEIAVDADIPSQVNIKLKVLSYAFQELSVTLQLSIGGQ